MKNHYFTVEEVANVLEIDQISASELLDETIEMEIEEAFKLAEYKGVTLNELARMLNYTDSARLN